MTAVRYTAIVPALKGWRIRRRSALTPITWGGTRTGRNYSGLHPNHALQMEVVPRIRSRQFLSERKNDLMPLLKAALFLLLASLVVMASSAWAQDVCQSVANNLIVNCGFETGDLSG